MLGTSQYLVLSDLKIFFYDDILTPHVFKEFITPDPLIYQFIAIDDMRDNSKFITADKSNTTYFIKIWDRSRPD